MICSCTADHQKLLDEMQFHGITGFAQKWVSSYLGNRNQYWRINCTISSIKYIYVVVPQGSCLGPLLLLLYASDLRFALKKTEATVYAEHAAITNSSVY